MIISQIARESLEKRACELGFALFGITHNQDSPGFDNLSTWLERGFAGSMDYLEKRLDAYRNPSAVLAGCRSVIMLGMPYNGHDRTIPRKSSQVNRPISDEAHSSRFRPGTIASYAVGDRDYHDVIRERLNSLSDLLQSMFPESRQRGVVDTAPLMERDFARLAGLGWIGKNTLLLHRKHGSYFFLAALLTTVELPEDVPLWADHCGTCRACLDACPTEAFESPYVLNASKCISHWTIEHRGLIPIEMRSKIGDWIFGCDVCQIVCPWNRTSASNRDRASHDATERAGNDEKYDCRHWLSIDEETFRRLYRSTPFWRTKLHGMQRNAMIVAANTGQHTLVSIIEPYLLSLRPELRATAAWALAELAHESSLASLQCALSNELDSGVALELSMAIDRLSTKIGLPGIP